MIRGSMRPPICDYCDRDERDHSGLEFGLVSFRNHRRLDRPGHPEGLLWFCQDHLERARALAALDSHEALRRMRAEDADRA
jgi:hypothetical protein